MTLQHPLLCFLLLQTLLLLLHKQCLLGCSPAAPKVQPQAPPHLPRHQPQQHPQHLPQYLPQQHLLCSMLMLNKCNSQTLLDMLGLQLQMSATVKTHRTRHGQLPA